METETIGEREKHFFLPTFVFVLEPSLGDVDQIASLLFVTDRSGALRINLKNKVLLNINRVGND